MSHKTYSAIYRLLAITIVIGMLIALLPGIASSQPAQAAPSLPTGLHDYEFWFGSQHAHTNMDGDDGATGSTAADAFAYAKNIPHLDYFIITPHVHDDRAGISLFSESTYDTMRTSANSATDANFVALAGQEVSTISSGGHWNLFNANDLIGTDHPDGDWNDGDDYYDHVAGLGAGGEAIAAQFNHASSGNFGNRYDANAAPYFGTFAVSSGYTGATEEDFSNNGSNLQYGTSTPYENLWATFLNMGWKVSPAADQDNHRATWGASASEYTVIVRPAGTALNQGAVIEGLQDHMTYATEDANMQIGFVANGWSMGQTIGGDSNVSFTIWWNNPSETLYNPNTGGSVTEPANDAIQNIWIYKNTFGTTGDSVGSNAGSYVAHYQPNTASGTWNITLSANTGDWFVVKFQDTHTFSTDATYGRTTSKDLTWSAPVWYDPTNADVQLTVDGSITPTPSITPGGPTPTNSPVPPTLTASATPDPSTGCGAVVLNEILPAASAVYSTDWIELYNPTGSTVDIGGCVIDDITSGDGSPYTIPGGTTVAAHGFWVLERGSVFNNAGDTVNLIDTDGTTVLDSYTYGSTAYDVSWYRSPDGDAWAATTTSSPTMGTSNGGTTPTDTPVPPTATSIPPTDTPVPPTFTPTPGSTSGCGLVVLNEILPAASAVYSLDWIELYNPTGSTVDIGGCVIDDITSGGGSPYTIPDSTTIAAYGFWVLERGSVFNNAGDTVNLLDIDGTTVLDSYTYPSTGYDVSWYRLPDGSAWATTTTSSPTMGTSNGGTTPTDTPVPPTNTPLPTATNTLMPTATNTPLPTATNTPIPSSDCGLVVLNEILPAASVVYALDWIELYNPTGSTVDIGSCVIDDITSGGGSPYTIPAGETIAAYGFWVLERGSVFNNAGDTVNLIDTDGTTIIDSYTYPSTAYDVSWYRSPDGGAWEAAITDSPTMGTSNNNAPVIYLSSSSGSSVGGVSANDEDIVAYDTATGTWSKITDMSDMGITTDLNAFDMLADGSILMSFQGVVSIDGLGSVDDSDVVKFIPTSLGATTSGSFEWYLDGSDVGLTTSGEDIDAVKLLDDGRLLISTVGSYSVSGVSGADEDLLYFTPTSLGASTSGSFAMAFDGSDVALNTSSSEDVNGTYANGDIYLSTIGSFSVSGLSGSSSDIFICESPTTGTSTSCTAFTLFFDGSAVGWGGEVTDAFDIEE